MSGFEGLDRKINISDIEFSDENWLKNLDNSDCTILDLLRSSDDIPQKSLLSMRSQNETEILFNQAEEDAWYRKQYLKEDIRAGVETGVKTVVIITGILATYAALSGIVKMASGTQMEEQTRVIPFTDASVGMRTYDKNIDERLKFVTAAVSLQLQNVCSAGGDISWDTLQAILAQCPVLEADQNSTDAQETFQGAFTEDNMSSWFYDFVKKYDRDIFDASRIHAPEINEIIQFVANQSTGFCVFSKSVVSSSSLLDIGIIRFPTEQDPHVKLYRLQLRGTFSGSRFMMVFTSGEKRTLTATVNSRKYSPRDDLLQRIRSDTIRQAITSFEDMLNSNAR